VIALFGGKSPNAPEKVRIMVPYAHCRKMGYLFDWARHQDMKELAQAGYPLAIYQAFVFPRAVDTDGGVVKLVRDLQRAGRKIIYEVDDDYTNQHRQVMLEGGDAMAVITVCDAVTVSTPYLAEKMRWRNPNVHVVPNCVDVAAWRKAKDARHVQGLTIGITGTPSHYDDWGVVLNPLVEILAEFGQVRIVFIGYVPDYFETLERVEHIPYLAFEHYPGGVRQIDIGLAPLNETDEFNLSKSAIKVLEYWASHRKYPEGGSGGIAAIASDMPVYQQVVQHGKTGLLVENTEDAWYKAIRQLVLDGNLRRQLGINGHRWVKRHRNIKNNYVEWVNAYRSIIAGGNNHG
jgi:glycosyltransferase involved in cell wall biosynthesis